MVNSSEYSERDEELGAPVTPPQRRRALPSAWHQAATDGALLLLVLGMCFLLLNPSAAKLWEDTASVGAHAGIFGGAVFDLLVLCVLCSLAGKAVASLGLPPLAGMLLMGFFLRQATATRGITALLNSKVRDVALGVIMARAGLGLDLRRLWTERGITTALSTVPMVVEASAVALFTWATGALTLPWGLLLGFILADVSPAVTVPLLMEFEEAGYGSDKGIPSILLAASGLNSVAAIVGYGTVFSILFANGLPAWAPALLGLVEIFGLGVGFGIAVGSMLLLIWPVTTPVKRFLLLLVTSIFLIQLGKKVGMSGGGALCTLLTAAWMAYKLRASGDEPQALLSRTTISDNSPPTTPSVHLCQHDLLRQLQCSHTNHTTTLSSSSATAANHATIARISSHRTCRQAREVSGFFGLAWVTAGQPLLFGLLGASVSIDKLKADHLLTGALVVVVGLVLRSLATFLCVKCGSSWNGGEVLFSVITWCPKATVQAALAGVALDYIKLTGDDYGSGDEYVDEMGEEYSVLRDRAEFLLTTGILSILMTAPLFAVLMYHSGRKFLKPPADASIPTLHEVYSRKDGAAEDEPQALVPSFVFEDASRMGGRSRANSNNRVQPWKHDSEVMAYETKGSTRPRTVTTSEVISRPVTTVLRQRASSAPHDGSNQLLIQKRDAALEPMSPVDSSKELENQIGQGEDGPAEAPDRTSYHRTSSSISDHV
ncbi:hypothetical protein AB1Y20_023388 [Prymnesium parvum]|uniref:Cation/H+ exchanger transmembrane domain-containing protein n=1 Tax=Prymnesium parvum TaxID=97485 RepID=A0AB34JDQ6_PRYPA